MALSGPLLAVTNRIAGSWWLFWPTLGRNKSALRAAVRIDPTKAPQRLSGLLVFRACLDDRVEHRVAAFVEGGGGGGGGGGGEEEP